MSILYGIRIDFRFVLPQTTVKVKESASLIFGSPIYNQFQLF